MKYLTEIKTAINDPEGLEKLYQLSRISNEEAEFRADIIEVADNTPDNKLLAAWRFRFANLPMLKPKRTTHWVLALVFGVISGLILWTISDVEIQFLDIVPYFFLLWAPIATIPAILYLTIVARKNYLYAAISCIALIVAGTYILLISPGLSETSGEYYLILMLIMLPLLSWIAIGVAVMGFRSNYTNRFAFMIKSIEVMITAGVYLIFGMAFGAITVGLFAALNITLPDSLIRFAAACGVGLISVLAIATVYDPQVPPEEQDFNQGLSKFVFTLVRLLLPLTLLVLGIYILMIPFNFIAPFENRNLLIVFNVMQFAIIGLLIGATPLKVDDLSMKFQTWLRRGIIAVAILALVISLYAMSAVVYRTVIGYLTLNRLAIIGWNIINIVILFALVLTQPRKSLSGWHVRLQIVFSKATTAYLVWCIIFDPGVAFDFQVRPIDFFTRTLFHSRKTRKGWMQSKGARS